MKVSDLIEFLKTQPQDIQVAYKCYSEQCVLDFDDIYISEFSAPRPDGWIQNARGDMQKQQYLLFPGN